MRVRMAMVLGLIFILPGAWAAPVAIDAVLDGLSLEHKIGQMHMIGYSGLELNDSMAGLIEQWGIGGFFFQFPVHCSQRRFINLYATLGELPTCLTNPSTQQQATIFPGKDDADVTAKTI